MAHEKKNKPWSTEDDDFMKINYGMIPTSEVCEGLGRTLNSVYQRARSLGLDATHLSIVKPKNKKQEQKQEQEQQQLFIEKPEENIASMVATLEKDYEKVCQENEQLKKTILKMKSFAEEMKIMV